VNEARQPARTLTVNRALELDLGDEPVALGAQINRPGSLDIAGDEALNIDLPAKKTAPVSARRQLIVERGQAPRHLAVELFGKRRRAEAQYRRNSRLYDEQAVLLGSKRRFFGREGWIGQRHRCDRASDAKIATQVHPAAAEGTHRRTLIEVSHTTGQSRPACLAKFPMSDHRRTT
jgi:hypothetical protein